MRRERSSAGDPLEKVLWIVLAVLVAAFLATSIVAQRMSADVESLSDRIVRNSTVGIEHLASIRGSVLEVEVALRRYLDEPTSARQRAGERLDGSMERLAGEVRGYLDLPLSAGEARYWRHLEEGWARFDEAIRRARALADEADQAGARAAVSRFVEPQAARLIEAALDAIEFNAQHGRTLAARIKQSRGRGIWTANALTVVCAILAAAGGLLIRRQVRIRRVLAEAHASALGERAAELEQFAGRVAHDIRNPLAAAMTGAELCLRRAADEPARRTAERLIRSLARAEAITTALLEFARSGGRPDPGARTDVRETLSDLASGVGPEAERAGIDLRFEPAPAVLLACSHGVYLSLVGNLVRNAIKYLGDVGPRRIVVRVKDEGAFVRTEVLDTGPGIPEESHGSLFDPYFRGATRGQSGLGLGLATVKKLAEGHGGRVGFRSKPGEGSTFWFLLPHAGTAWTSTPVEESAFAEDTAPTQH